MATDAQIRWMINRDMSDVLWIEQTCFDHPWDEADFNAVLIKRNCIGMVVVLGEEVIGYVIYELEKQSINILNLAIHPSYCRRGHGSSVIHKMKSKLQSTPFPRRTICLQVRETNLPAQKFFRHHGFLATKIVKNAYEDTDEDAYMMEYVKQEILSECESR